MELISEIALELGKISLVPEKPEKEDKDLGCVRVLANLCSLFFNLLVPKIA